MADSKFENTHIILASSCIFLGALYVFNSQTRHKNQPIHDQTTVSEKPNWLSHFVRSFSFGRVSNQDNLNRPVEYHHHPEGPNIGFESHDSWIKNNSTENQATAKIDLLHQGHTKGGKLIVVMVGLPGRGKTYIARKIARYLRWISYRTRAFSLAKYRLDQVGSKTAEFFDPSSSTNYQQRNHLIMEALEDTLSYLSRGGEIAIIDGTNTTRDRRQLIRDRISKETGYEVLWIESIYKTMDDTELTHSNVKLTTSAAIAEKSSDPNAAVTSTLTTSLISASKLKDLENSPDFVDKEDYLKRLALYKQYYEPLDNTEGSYVKYFDNGKEIVLHEIFGFLRTKIVSYLMNLHTSPKPIYMVRHGESDFNTKHLIGGDSGLSELGLEFSQALNRYLHDEELSEEDSKNLIVWTSNMKRSRQTAQEISFKKIVEWRSLREIEVGICDGLSYEQVKIKFPDEYRSRQGNKLTYRYPRGESYLDVLTRLEPVIFELERQREPLVIVAHQAVLRCLYAYFLDLPAEEIPFLSIPLHTLVKLEMHAYGCKEKRVRIVTSCDSSSDLEPSTNAMRRKDSMALFQS